MCAADLVVKRSTDGGSTWSDLSIVYGNSSSSSHYYTIGNAAPIQIESTGQILVPFCRNNALIFITESTDDGVTWSEPRQIQGIVQPDWTFVATGPPSSIQLPSGRIVTPSYRAATNLGSGSFMMYRLVLLLSRWWLSSPVTTLEPRGRAAHSSTTHSVPGSVRP